MEGVLVVGAGGFGREIFYYAAEAAEQEWPFRIAGFLDDNPSALRSFGIGLPLMGPMMSVELLAGKVMIAIGDPGLRRVVRQRVAAVGGQLVTLIHPQAYVAPQSRIGDGVIVGPGAFIGTGASVADNVAVNALASVGHDVTVGSDAVLSPHAAISGWADVGDGVLLGTHSTVTPGVRVGAWSKLSAGSVVTGNAPAGSLLVGNPAKGRVIFASPTES